MKLTAGVQKSAVGICVFLLAGAPLGAANGADSEWVYAGPDGKLVYKTTPADDKIMDFSYAGYMGGGIGSGMNGSTIKMVGGRHVAISVGRSRGRERIPDAGPESGAARTSVSDACTFLGNGHIEGHQRWMTGMLLDNCKVPEGGIDFKNRGSMGSGHGWGTGWSVAWNCVARTYVVQQPPGAFNWMIGCVGENVPTPRPFDSSPTLPLGISDSPGTPVSPRSLYLAQLAERLGPQAVKNIGY